MLDDMLIRDIKKVYFISNLDNFKIGNITHSKNDIFLVIDSPVSSDLSLNTLLKPSFGKQGEALIIKRQNQTPVLSLNNGTISKVFFELLGLGKQQEIVTTKSLPYSIETTAINDVITLDYSAPSPVSNICFFANGKKYGGIYNENTKEISITNSNNDIISDGLITYIYTKEVTQTFELTQKLCNGFFTCIVEFEAQVGNELKTLRIVANKADIGNNVKLSFNRTSQGVNIGSLNIFFLADNNKSNGYFIEEC